MPRNIAALNDKLRAAGVAAAVATSGKNVWYLSEAPTSIGMQQDRADGPRTVIVLWPVDQEPTLIVGRFESGVTPMFSTVSDIRYYEDYVVPPYDLLVEVIRERGLQRSRLGIELSTIAPQRLEMLERALPEAELVDVSAALDETRAIKSRDEIEAYRKAAADLDAAFAYAFERATVGMPELEVHAQLAYAALAGGAASLQGIFQSGDNARIIHLYQNDKPLGAGDIIHTDYAAKYRNGAVGHASRVAVVGAPSREQARMYQQLLDVHRKTYTEFLQPGRSGEEVFQLCRQAIRDAGFEHFQPLIGHSIGLGIHERPMLTPGERMGIEPNMIMAVEPRIDVYHIQDLVLVTEEGGVLLSDAFDTSSLHVID